MNRLALIASAAALAIGSVATGALADESRIRQADQQTEVRGPLTGYIYFTVSGFPTDIVSAPFAYGTIRALRSSPLVRDVVTGSGGQLSLRFAVPSHWSYNGKVVTVSRDGAQVDSDRIVLR